MFKKANDGYLYCMRPYHIENTSSRPITEVKQYWAMLVLGWVTAWEYMGLLSFFFLNCMSCVEFAFFECLWPYHIERNGSRLITDVKQRFAALVLGWVTTWEYLFYV